MALVAACLVSLGAAALPHAPESWSLQSTPTPELPYPRLQAFDTQLRRALAHPNSLSMPELDMAPEPFKDCPVDLIPGVDDVDANRSDTAMFDVHVLPPAGLVAFNTFYTLPAESLVNVTAECSTSEGVAGANCSEVKFHMMGFHPRGGGHYPVYIFISGGGVWRSGFNATTPELFMVQKMAERGFLAVMIEVPNIWTLSCTTLNRASSAVFSYMRDDNADAPGALATLCRHQASDCDAGVALHGHSLGGSLSTLAPKYADSVSGLLVWGAGSRVPYGGSCCGLFAKQTCCSEGGAVGGSDLRCLEYANTRMWLDRSRKRTIIYTFDFEYGDCMFLFGSPGPPSILQRPDTLRDMVPGAPDSDRRWSTPICNGTDAQTGSLFLLRRDSGYDCGGNVSCIQSDGSGYYVPSQRQVGNHAVGPCGNGKRAHPSEPSASTASSVCKL